MSKRFGRNQKHKLKEVLERAQDNNARLQSQVEYLKTVDRQALDIIAMVKEINPDFPALKRARTFDQLRYNKESYIEGPVRYGPNYVLSNNAIDTLHIPLEQLKVDLIGSEDFNRCVRFKYWIGDKWVYSFSAEGLRYARNDSLYEYLMCQAEETVRRFLNKRGEQ